MSVSSLGMPIPMGIAHGFHTDNITYSLLANCIPPTILFKYDKPIQVSNEEELNSIDTSNIDPGSGYYITTKYNGIVSTSQYVYDPYLKRFLLLNNPINKDYLNIYALYEGTNLSSYDFFMRINISNIRSNIKILSLLDTNFGVYNTEFFSLLGVSGSYSLDNTISNNILTPLLELNIRNGLHIQLRLLLSLYDIQVDDNKEYNFDNFYNSIIECTNEILRNNMSNYINLYNEKINMDTSMFINYIGSSFASFRQVLTEYYNTNNLPSVINPLIPLALIDQPLINKINLNTIVNNVFNNDILYSINSTLFNKYYPFLLSLVEYCMIKNSRIKDISSTRSDFLEDVCELVGGIVSLALYFSIFSNGNALSRTILYLHFVAPKKFNGFF